MKIIAPLLKKLSGDEVDKKLIKDIMNKRNEERKGLRVTYGELWYTGLLLKNTIRRKAKTNQKRFIKDKYDGKSKEEFPTRRWILWKDIDHSYMQRTIDDLTQKVMDQDHVTMRKQQSLPNKYELNLTQDFIDRKQPMQII